MNHKDFKEADYFRECAQNQEENWIDKVTVLIENEAKEHENGGCNVDKVFDIFRHQLATQAKASQDKTIQEIENAITQALEDSGDADVAIAYARAAMVKLQDPTN